MLGIVIYHTNLKINNQDCIFLRTSQFPIAIYNYFNQDRIIYKHSQYYL